MVQAAARPLLVPRAILVRHAKGRLLWFIFRLCGRTGATDLDRLSGWHRLLRLQSPLLPVTFVASMMSLVLEVLMPTRRVCMCVDPGTDSRATAQLISVFLLSSAFWTSINGFPRLRELIARPGTAVECRMLV